MKAILSMTLAVALIGCAGLNVSWEVIATYNTPHATPGHPVPVTLSTKDEGAGK